MCSITTYNSSNTISGRFTCPMDQDHESNTYCCGKEGEELCCGFWDDWARVCGIVFGIIGALVVVTVLVIIVRKYGCIRKKNVQGEMAYRVYVERQKDNRLLSREASVLEQQDESRDIIDCRVPIQEPDTSDQPAALAGQENPSLSGKEALPANTPDPDNVELEAIHTPASSHATDSVPLPRHMGYYIAIIDPSEPPSYADIMLGNRVRPLRAYRYPQLTSDSNYTETYIN